MSYFDLRVCMIPVAEFCPCDEARLKRLKQEYGEHAGITVSVQDNGKDGDGCQLNFKYDDAKEDDWLACIAIGDSTIPTLIEALRAVQRLRAAETGREDEDD